MTKEEFTYSNYDNDGVVARHVELNDREGRQEEQLQQQDQKEQEKRKEGLILLFVSAFLFSIMGMFLQFTGRMGLPSTELVFIRAAFQGTFVVIGMIFYRVDDDQSPSTSNTSDKKEPQDDDDDGDVDDVEAGGGVHMVEIHDNLIEEKKKLEDGNDCEKSSLLSNTQKHKYNTISATDQTEGSSTSPSKILPPRIIQRPFGTTPTMCKVLILRGIVGAFGFINFYYTLSTLPLGDATTLLSLYPIVTIFLAWFVLGEEIKPVYFTAALLCVSGATLISRPTFLFGNDNENDDQYDQPPTLGYITAFVGNFCASGVIVLIRKAGRAGAHTLQLLFSWAVFGMATSLTAGAIAASVSEDQQWRIPSREELPSVLGICVSGSVAHFFLNYAAKLIPSTLASLIRSSDVFWAYLLEIIVLGQHPHRETLMGTLLVCSSLVVVVLSSGEKASKGLKHPESVGNLTAIK